MSRIVDELDRKIISYLHTDGRMPYTKIADDLGVPEATIRNRAQKLIQDKIIQIVAVCEPEYLGYPVVGNIKIQAEPMKLDSVLAELKTIDKITYIALLTGVRDIDMDFVATSMEDLRKLLYERIRKIDGVINIDTSFILSIEKENYRYAP